MPTIIMVGVAQVVGDKILKDIIVEFGGDTKVRLQIMMMVKTRKRVLVGTMKILVEELVEDLILASQVNI